jgi:hypothetical protein
MVTQWVIAALRCRRTRWLHLQYFTCNICLHNAFHWLVKKHVIHQPWPSLTTPPNFRQSFAENQMILNFGNDCAQLCVAVAERDTQAISFSRRQCNDFTTIALPSPEKYCPCIRSFMIVVRTLFIYTHAQKHISLFIRFRHAHKRNFLPQLKCSRLGNKSWQSDCSIVYGMVSSDTVHS